MKHGDPGTGRKILLILAGAAVYALAFNAFFVPNAVAFGGLTGIAQMIHALVPALPVGLMVLVFNIPLFFLAWRYWGRQMLALSLGAMVCSSFLLDLFGRLYTFPPMEDTLLACLAGGVALGAGLGLIFLQGATTGGTEIVARLLQRKLAWLPVGKLLLFTDLAVIAAVALAFRRLDTALYGVVALTVSTGVMDRILYGLDTAKVAYIISGRPEEIRRYVVDTLNRSVTLLHGEGGYTGAERQVLLCVFKERQIVPLKAAVRQIDPHAFMIVTSAQEVLGEGFHSYEQN